MLSSILANLGGVARFSGRTTRAQFWPYAIAVFVLTMAILVVATTLEVNRSVGALTRFLERNPIQVTMVGPGTVLSGPPVISKLSHPELAVDLDLIVEWSALSAGIAVVLLAGAVARRLHDSGIPAFWGMLPIPFLAFSLAEFTRAVGPLTPFKAANRAAVDFGIISLFLASNFVYVAAVATLVVLLCRDSGGPNRFGPPVP